MKPSQVGAKLVAGTLAFGLALEATAAAAQPPPPPSGYYQGQPPPSGYQPPPPGYQTPPAGYQQPYGGPPVGSPYGAAPPPGQYAPPPPGYEQSGAVYDDRAQRADRDYADRYSRWAAQYCMDKRANNSAAGAIIGGILGAVVGSNVSGRHSKTGGSIIGGALGATAGAAIGRNAAEQSGACPPGYYIRAGAPAFYYGGPAVYVGPAWYNPWAFEGGVWVYRPYRYWYWTHESYWRPGWRPGPWDYHYRRY
ncbi:glycine zipper domain-containing protein [Phenylobacterium sp.]|jgi:hypothetical protein|uniref:glycine zipper domain-containing protein n=1 Tax=Phenylobacterium sp. TaxID=1871053 RepID=UPI002F41E9A0